MIKTVMGNQLSVISRAANKTLSVSAAFYFSLFTSHFSLLTFYFLLFTLHSSLFTLSCHAAESETVITANTLEYFHADRKCLAKGAVKVQQEDVTVEAEEMIYYEETGDVTVKGNVRYSDLKTFFTAKTAEMNIEKKTGKLYEAEIFFKEDNYHLKGVEIERKAINEFYSRAETTVTTCDGPLAAWCFRAKEINLSVNDQITGWDVSFRIRDIPLLYSPYLWAPVNNDRKTGFLIPAASHSSARGLGLSIPFFWAISENRDATFLLDVFSQQGIGAGLQYRYLEPDGLRGAGWLYRIHDAELHRDFLEFQALHDNRSVGGSSLFLNANYVNEKDYYRQVVSHEDISREISQNREKQIQRFIESTAEVNIPFDNARAYLLAQYWIDLEHSTAAIAQKLPELGYVLNYTRFGSFFVSAEAAAVNFRKNNGVSARRLALYPTVLHAAGSDVVLSQTAAMRGTAYEFYGNGPDSDHQRLSVEYDGNLHARFLRRYASFTHVVEPTVRYHYISKPANDLLYTFDEWEMHGKTSGLELSLLNRFIGKGEELATVRITQPLDLNDGNRPFRPLVFELGAQKPLPARVSAAYDFNTGKLQSVSSDINIPFAYGSMNFGQRYNMPEDISVFRAGLEFQPVKPIQVGLAVRYDAKGEGLRQAGAYVQYSSQCWGVRIELLRKSGDFSVLVKFDLFGVTAKRPKDL